MKKTNLVIMFFIITTTLCIAVNAQNDTSCGIIWEPPILLSDTAYDAHSPKIALSGDDTVHIVWEGGGMRLSYIQSDNGGISFLPVRDILIDSLYGPGIGHTPFVVTSGLRVYVFFIHAWGIGDSPVKMLLSTDGGFSWSSMRTIGDDMVGNIQSVAVLNDTIGIVEPSITFYRRILRSTDGGETWTKTSEDLSIWTRVALSEKALHLILLNDTTGQTEYRCSHNLGDTWIQKTFLSSRYYISALDPMIAVGSNSQNTRIVTAWRDPKYGCLGIYGCSIISRTGILNSPTDSVIWRKEEVLTEQPRGYIPAIAVRDSMRLVAWNQEVIAGNTFHVVSRLSRNLDQPWCVEVDHTKGAKTAEISAVALSKKAVHIVWHQYVEGSPQPQTLRVYNRRGVFQTTDVKEGKKELPEEFHLSQNYPNPFNPSTKIKYKVQSTEYISIKVYDVFGREVATLVNEKKQPGEYEVEWNPENLASGMYFYRLTAGRYVETKKAILKK